MSTIALKNYNKRQFGGFTPYGNLTVLHFALRTNASGAAIDADSTSAIASGDVVDLGPLPEGFRLEDAQIIVSTAMSASVTGSLGFKYEDGVDDTTAPQDAAYFGSGLALATAARVRAAGSKLITLPKPARLILTTGGAANAKASDINVLVTGELTGPK